MSVFDDATLYAPLKTSLILSNGTGNPTFTRATVANTINEGGYVQQVASGVARFTGARFVRNRISTTANFSSGNWQSFAGNITLTTGQSDIDGGTDATLLTVVANSTALLRDQSSLTVSADTLDRGWGFWFKTGNHAWLKMQLATSNESSSAQIWFNPITGVIGTVSGNNWTVLSSGITPHPTLANWYFIYMTARAATADIGLTYQPQLWFQDGDGSNLETAVAGGTLTIYKPQYCVLSNSTSKVINSEDFLSVGVLSSPWHGAGIDGAKWFNTDGSLTSLEDSTLKGIQLESAATNSVLHSRDLTNAAWVKTNTTAARNTTGADNILNLGSRLTASANNGTCLQTITLAAASRSFSAYIKRITGTGTVEITRDGGSTWTDVTSLINSSTYTRVSIKGTSVLNPQVGFRLGTSGDVIAIDFTQDEAGALITSPISTTTTAVTRNKDVLSYQTTSNISDTAGALAATVYSEDWINATGNIGSASTGLGLSSSNSGVQAKDGTNTVNGPSGNASDSEKLAIHWATTILKAASGGVVATPGSYDGSLNLTSILLDVHANVRDLYTWTTALTDADLSQITGTGSANIYHNQDLYNLLGSYGYIGTYNDRLLAYLRDLFSKTNSSLPDLVARYIKTNGELVPPQ